MSQFLIKYNEVFKSWNWIGFTLPLVLDLRPGTVRWRLVSERQLDKEVLIEPKSSSLRLLLIRESNESGGWSWLWFWLNITEAEIVVSFLDLGLVLKERIEGGEWVLIGILGLRVLGGFKLRIHWAISLSLSLSLSVCHSPSPKIGPGQTLSRRPNPRRSWCPSRFRQLPSRVWGERTPSVRLRLEV